MAAPIGGQCELLKQGAEAKLYKGNFYGKSCIIKERFPKTYRHPVLDKSLTIQRTKGEVRAMFRCRMNGILTPTVYFVNHENNSIYMEEISDSQTVRDYIITLQKDLQDHQAAINTLKPLAQKIGLIIGRMHANNIVHGDLTTSNMLIKGRPADLNIVMIDFGLSYSDSLAEDKGVDLYVLERALLSTHPNTEELFEAILDAYKGENSREPGEVIKKLDEVRLRGRKRTMVG